MSLELFPEVYGLSTARKSSVNAVHAEVPACEKHPTIFHFIIVF